MTNFQTQPPVRMSMTGLGGYAGLICRLLLEQGARPDPPVVLEAVCEPNPAAHALLAETLRAQGVPVFEHWHDLLARPAEAVWLPLPIPLHRPYTEQALAAGRAVMCEKPAAGSVQDCDAMRHAQEKAGLPVALGFQDIYEPSTRLLKQAVREDIGPVRFATLTACWPRDSRYYERSAWAGKQKVGADWVLDSPASNALAHFVNLSLFLLGDEDGASAVPVRVEAELYRANPIDNYDTCGLRVITQTGATLLVLLTHACRQSRAPSIVVEGENGTLSYVSEQEARVTAKGGPERRIALPPISRAHMTERFAHLVRGIPDPRCVADLDMGRAHLVVVNGASEASPVRAVPSPYVDSVPTANGVQYAIRDVETLFEACALQNRLPHETGLAAWTSPAGGRDLTGYRFFRGPAEE